MKFKHSVCPTCYSVGLDLKVGEVGRCNLCDKIDSKLFAESNCLPFWEDENGETRTDVPDELKDLTIAEKLLIQLISPLVPLKHIKKGTFGLSGHVCAFEQDVNSFATTLPNLPHGTTILKVTKEATAEIGCKDSITKAFTVNKCKVIDALKWLKKHNDLYKGIKIDESRLDSIEDCDDISKLVSSDDVVTKEDEALNINTDLGPNREETIAQMKSNEAESLGFQNLDDPIEISKDDRQILKELQESISKSPEKRHMTICWPKTSEVPVSEYSRKKLFAMAYP